MGAAGRSRAGRWTNFLPVALFGFALLAPSGATAAAGGGPEAVVAHLQTALIAAMRAAPDLTPAQRRARLAPVIRDTHDLPFIAHFALGRIWKGLSTADRDRFVAAFSEMSIATYAERFDSYSGERFRILSSRAAERGGEEVRTVLVKSDGATVSLDYLLRRRDGRWRIINVVSEGVSNLALKRAEYAGFVRRHDFNALMNEMEARLAARTAGTAAPTAGR